MLLPAAGRASRYHGSVTVTIVIRPIGVLRSELVDLAEAPRQGDEGAPDAWVEIDDWARAAAVGIAVGDELLLVTWLDRARRDVLQVHPRGDQSRPLTGVFATRSAHRPNPLGLHAVSVRAFEPGRLRVGPIEAVDGTPVLDIKPALGPRASR